MIINHNLMANNAIRNMNINSNNASKSMQKLSSGLRINGAADDAAGLAISEKMRSQIRGLDQASANAQDGISLTQTAEGALNETTSMLQRMRELTVQANNGTNQDSDRKNIQDEISQLQTEITNVSTRTEFNSQKLLDGTFGAKLSSVGTKIDGTTTGNVFSVTLNGAAAASDWTITTGDGSDATVANNSITVASATLGVSQTIAVTDINAVTKGQSFNFDGVGVTLKATASDLHGLAANNTFTVSGTNKDLQVGANAGQQMNISINNMSSNALGVDTIDVSQAGYGSTQFDTDIAAIDSAINKVSEERSKLGAYQNRLEHTINNLGTSSENLTASESRIRDVDMAKEMSTFSKNNILSQAAQAMLAQANQQPQQVLQLLR